MTKRYYAGNRLLATRTGTSLYFIQPDHLGSASTVTDASGQVVARERYSAFGERRRGESPTTTDYLYTDQRYSASVGFYHYTSGAPGRQYDPLLGRFLQADPVSQGSGQGLNRYVYVFNKPLTLTDPSGYDALGPDWIDAFRAARCDKNRNSLPGMVCRAPNQLDRSVRLFSLAFPDEWIYWRFYEADGTLKDENLIVRIFRNPPGDRNWSTMRYALENLARAYTYMEIDMYVRDIATLFGGLRDRIERPFSETAICADLCGGIYRHRADLNDFGLDPRLIGTADDGNVRHWAWTVLLGFHYGSHVASALNGWREILQVIDPNPSWEDFMADYWIGERGVRFGSRLAGASIFTNWFEIYGVPEVAGALFQWYMFDRRYDFP